MGSVLASAGIVFGVHFMQRQESEVSISRNILVIAMIQRFVKTMYKGVLRDDERRREKMQQREAEFAESQRKRALYETVQQVSRTDSKQSNS